MRQVIRHILKENNIKQELKKVIEDDGLFKAADFVGGMTNLKSILKDEPEISSLFDKLTGTIFFYYYMGNGRYMKNMKFPLKYEIIGRKSNIHNTNHWPEINVFYDENKLTPEENDTFKSMIKYLIDETNHSDFDAKKFNNYKTFNVNYFTVKELNGENIDLIGGWDFSNSEVKDIHDKLYDNTEILDESTNSETDPTQKILNFLLRRYKIDEVDLGWADNPIKLKMIKFDIDGERYSISTFENKRQQIAKILDMLTIHNVIDDIDSNEGKLDPYTQKVVRAVKQFINQVMDNKSNMNESEITERCWKGYTQKGMKTMFGKEYPNCVKIKKKKSVRETIKDMLDEEVTKKYSKPTEKVEQLVYRWLNDYFDGAQMYHNKSWESTHSFEFCNNGKEIMDVILYFHNDENVYDDKRKTEERDFESGSITIPKNILIELSSDIPVRVSYLKYIFEEWFDDTYLGEIQKFMGRNDIYISEFDIMNVDAQTCVPPMTKPEDVTEEDMIEYILKTTLYGRDKILKYENEKPGFIEKTYLSKLRQAEIEKVRGY